MGDADTSLADRLSGLLILVGGAFAPVLLREFFLGRLESTATAHQSPVAALREFIVRN